MNGQKNSFQILVTTDSILEPKVVNIVVTLYNDDKYVSRFSGSDIDQVFQDCFDYVKANLNFS